LETRTRNKGSHYHIHWSGKPNAGCIHYDGGRIPANQILPEAMNTASLRQLAKGTGLHKETIFAIRRGQKVKASTLAKVWVGLREK
jgi:hypothetical protein